jgi:hypothetical protein
MELGVCAVLLVCLRFIGFFTLDGQFDLVHVGSLLNTK